jgi:hypothetical protein
VVPRSVLLLVVLTVLAAPAVGHGGSSTACRRACGTAVEGCIAWRTAALRDVEAPARVIRRKAKAIRRGCNKAAVRQCRAEGLAACDTPVVCACGR